MFCEKCGKSMNYGAEFCVNCGAPVKMAMQSSVGYSGQQYAQPGMVHMNTQQQSSALSQSYVYQVNEKKTKKKFSTIGTFSFWAWVLFLILGNQITLSVGIKASNAILLVFTLISGCLCFFDIKCGDKKYSKGLSIASLCFSVLIIILILVFSI